MYFLSSTYRNSKLLFSITGGLCAVGLIVTGILTHGASILIIGGSIWLVESILLSIDSSKILSDIKKQINLLDRNVKNFQAENLVLGNSISNINRIKDQFVVENNLLSDSLKISKLQLDKLNEIKINYESLIDNEKKNIVDLTLQKDLFVIENANLKESIENGKRQIIDLEKTKNDYVFENERLKKINNASGLQLIQFKKQVDNLKDIYKISQDLVKQVVNASDVFSGVENKMNQDLNAFTIMSEQLSNNNADFEYTLDKLHHLTTNLADLKFREIDTNHDEIITRDEFDLYFSSTRKN